MTNSFDWSRKKAERFSKIFPYDSINLDALEHATGFFGRFCSDLPIDLQFISAPRQSSFITHRGQQNAIYFDIGQSLVLKNLLHKIKNNENYISLCETLKESAALYISSDDESYGIIISELPVLPVHSVPHYLVTKEQVEKYENDFKRIRWLLNAPMFDHLVDWYILGHEVYHYFHHVNHNDIEGADRSAKDLFKLALEECCYENQDNFEDIANSYGMLSLSPEALEIIRQDLINRRKYYTDNEANLCEEIACDFWSFFQIADFVFDHISDSIQNTYDFSAIFFLLFSVFDLHYAMIRRSSLSLTSGIDKEKPANIADIHLRKMALLYATYQYHSARADFKGLDLQAELSFAVYKQNMGSLKLAIDSLYVAPSARLFQDIYSRAEDCRRIFQKLSTESKTGSFVVNKQALFDVDQNGHFFR